MTDREIQTLVRKLQNAGSGKHPAILCRYCGKPIQAHEAFEYVKRRNKTESWWHARCFKEELKL